MVPTSNINQDKSPKIESSRKEKQQEHIAHLTANTGIKNLSIENVFVDRYSNAFKNSPKVKYQLKQIQKVETKNQNKRCWEQYDNTKERPQFYDTRIEIGSVREFMYLYDHLKAKNTEKMQYERLLFRQKITQIKQLELLKHKNQSSHITSQNNTQKNSPLKKKGSGINMSQSQVVKSNNSLSGQYQFGNQKRSANIEIKIKNESPEKPSIMDQDKNQQNNILEKKSSMKSSNPNSKVLINYKKKIQINNDLDNYTDSVVNTDTDRNKYLNARQSEDNSPLDTNMKLMIPQLPKGPKLGNTIKLDEIQKHQKNNKNQIHPQSANIHKQQQNQNQDINKQKLNPNQKYQQNVQKGYRIQSAIINSQRSAIKSQSENTPQQIDNSGNVPQHILNNKFYISQTTKSNAGNSLLAQNGNSQIPLKNSFIKERQNTSSSQQNIKIQSNNVLQVPNDVYSPKTNIPKLQIIKSAQKRSSENSYMQSLNLLTAKQADKMLVELLEGRKSVRNCQRDDKEKKEEKKKSQNYFINSQQSLVSPKQQSNPNILRSGNQIDRIFEKSIRSVRQSVSQQGNNSSILSHKRSILDNSNVTFQNMNKSSQNVEPESPLIQIEDQAKTPVIRKHKSLGLNNNNNARFKSVTELTSKVEDETPGDQKLISNFDHTPEVKVTKFDNSNSKNKLIFNTSIKKKQLEQQQQNNINEIPALMTSSLEYLDPKKPQKEDKNVQMNLGSKVSVSVLSIPSEEHNQSFLNPNRSKSVSYQNLNASFTNQFDPMQISKQINKSFDKISKDIRFSNKDLQKKHQNQQKKQKSPQKTWRKIRSKVNKDYNISEHFRQHSVLNKQMKSAFQKSTIENQKSINGQSLIQNQQYVGLYM